MVSSGTWQPASRTGNRVLSEIFNMWYVYYQYLFFLEMYVCWFSSFTLSKFMILEVIKTVRFLGANVIHWWVTLCYERKSGCRSLININRLYDICIYSYNLFSFQWNFNTKNCWRCLLSSLCPYHQFPFT